MLPVTVELPGCKTELSRVLLLPLGPSLIVFTSAELDDKKTPAFSTLFAKGIGSFNWASAEVTRPLSPFWMTVGVAPTSLSYLKGLVNSDVTAAGNLDDCGSMAAAAISSSRDESNFIRAGKPSRCT